MIESTVVRIILERQRARKIALLIFFGLSLGSAPAHGLPRCRATQLALAPANEGLIANGGTVVLEFILTNRSSTACTLRGYPRAMALDERGRPVPEISFEDLDGFIAEPSIQTLRTIKLRPQAHAWFEVVGSDGMGLEDLSRCGLIRTLSLKVPGDRHPLAVKPKFSACDLAKISFFLPGIPD